MPYAIEAQCWGLKKEGTRLTAETTPNVWFPVDPDSRMMYALKTVEDKGLRGIKSPYPPFPGIKECTGKLKFPVRARNIGEFFVMLLGAPTTTQQGGSAAYQQEWIGVQSTTQPITYTIFVDRSLDVLKYSGCCAKTIDITVPVDGAALMEVDLVGITEASGSIGSPTYTESEMLEFYQTTIKIGGSSDVNVHNLKVKLDQKTIAKRALTQTQDAIDIITPERMMITGSFKIFFESETNRNNFLALTTTSLELIMQGSVIASTYHNQLDLLLPKIAWKKYELSAEAGLLAADVDFEAYYDTGTSKQLQLDIINTVTAY